MAHAKNHDYHILTPSRSGRSSAPSAGFVMLFGAVLWMNEVTAADIPLYALWVFSFGLLMVCAVHHVRLVGRCGPRGQ